MTHLYIYLTMRKTIIYLSLSLLLLTFSPLRAVASPQQTDISKPTRERVKKGEKQNDKKNDKKNDKPTEKSEAKPTATKQSTTPKPTTQKTESQAPAQVAADKTQITQGDTSKSSQAKPATQPKPQRKTLDPKKVQFDGIDVSKHQGYINWEELRKNSKIKYVFIKATEGSDYVDPRYKENIRNARKNGFKVGSYHFFTNKSSATTQFYNFLRNVKPEEQDLLPVIDVEVRNKWTSQQLRDSIKVFADLIEEYYGCKPIIYTGERFFIKHLGMSFANYPLFIAKYSNSAPNIGYKWILWQFSDCGSFKSTVGGNYGEVDLSRFNNGCTINDITYKPGKAKPKSSVRDAVDRKEKPSSVTLTEQKTKEQPAQSKRQQEDAKKKAEKERKAKERSQKLAAEEAKKKAEAEKKAKEKEERLKKEKARQQAREAAAKKEAEEKAKRKADAQKAREEKAKQNANRPSNKSTSLLQSSHSRLSQSQRNDSIRNAKLQGRKTNKSSADND